MDVTNRRLIIIKGEPAMPVVVQVAFAHQPIERASQIGEFDHENGYKSATQAATRLFPNPAEGMGFEPTTGFPAPDFESGRSPFAYPPEISLILTLAQKLATPAARASGLSGPAATFPFRAR